MPVETLAVTSTDALWTNFGGANRTVSVAAPDDDDTTYIEDATNSTTSFSVANSALTTETINSVAVVIRGKAPLGGGGAPGLDVIAWVGASSTTNNITSWTAAYATTTLTMATKPGGGAWSVADVNALVLDVTGMVELTNFRVTTITVDVDYNAAGGGGVHTVPMMGAGLL